MTTRRSLLLASAAGLSFGAPRARAQTIPHPPPFRAHSVPGGMGGVVSARYGLTGLGVAGNLGTITLPLADKVFLLPLTTTLFDESGGDDFGLSNQMVQIRKTGKYRTTLTLDWAAQWDVDIDLREYGIQRLQVGESFVVAPLPTLTAIVPDKWDRLANYDVPGSDSPVHARSASGTKWRPGVVAAGTYVYVDVPVTPAGSVKPGDDVRVGLSTLTSTLLGPAVDLLQLRARVDAPDVVRVMLFNTGTAAVTVPQGQLKVMAESLTDYRGRSTDGWLTVQSAAEVLLEGEQVFCFFRSKFPGDFVQVTNQSFLQVEMLG
jgi:hypothetical protein